MGKTNILNNKGMSLINVLMAMSVGTIVAGAVGGVIIQQAKMQKRIEARSDVSNLNSDILAKTYYPDGCTKIFKGQFLNKDLKDTVVTDRSKKNKNDKKEDVFENNSIEISNLILGNINDENLETIEGHKIYSASLRVMARLMEVESSSESKDKLKEESTVDPNKENKVKDEGVHFSFRERTAAHLVLEVNETHHIERCYNIGSGEAANGLIPVMCASMGGTYDTEKGHCVREVVSLCEQLGGSWENEKCRLREDTADESVVVAGNTGSTQSRSHGCRNRVIRGSNGDDRIISDCGDDLIRGAAGNDRIAGNKGRDTLYGGSGKDILRGRRGRDKLYGGAGNDLLIGGRGRDVLKGGKGHDTLKGGLGRDRIIAGNGDTVRGGRGKDNITVNLRRGQSASINGKRVRVKKNGIILVNGKRASKNFRINGDKIKVKVRK